MPLLSWTSVSLAVMLQSLNQMISKVPFRSDSLGFWTVYSLGEQGWEVQKDAILEEPDEILE